MNANRPARANSFWKTGGLGKAGRRWQAGGWARCRGPLAAVLAVVLIGTVLTAIDAAGPAVAAAPTALAGHWTFDDGSGTTATDSAGGHDATLTAGAGWGTGIQGSGTGSGTGDPGTALTTNGTNGYADTGAAIVDATKSFSINAWVKLGRVTGYQTVVSIDGDQVSNFFLQFRDDTRRFAFVRLPADQAAGAPAFPSATSDPVAAQWYMLTGVYDSTADTLSLYVDGQLEATTAAPPAWAPSGHLVIGRGKFGGSATDWVSGSIDDVRAYAAVLAPAEVAQLATFGSWRMDEGSGRTVADSALTPHDATLAGGTSWTAGAVGAHAVTFDGTSGVADVPATVLDTTQSFSVAAWVRVGSDTGFRTVLSVDGTQVSGFFLQRRNDGRFAFTRLGSDASTASTALAESTATVAVGQWYQLVGVYDSVARTLSLYVDGTLQQTVPFSTPWRATGHLEIGRGWYAGAPVDFFAGAISDVRTYPFPLTPAWAQALATTGTWHFDEGSGTVAADSSPLGVPGTLRGAGWVAGAANTAVAFDGASDVTMGDTPALNLGTGPLSVAAWLRTSAAGTQPLVEKGTSTATGSGYRLGVDAGHVTARIGGGAGRLAVATVAASYADGGWHHAAVVLDRTAATLTLYLDGHPAPITTASGSCGTVHGSTVDASGCAAASADSDEPFTVGSTSGGAPWLTGAVDEVEVARYPLSASQVAALAGANSLTVNATDVRAATDGNQYGGMLEDISHSVDGGLYAELVRNRTFEESYQAGSGAGDGPVPYWSLRTGGGATGSFALDTTTPLNTAITRSLKVSVDSLPAGASLAAANVGYYGVAVTPSTTYTGSLWAKATSGFTGTAKVSLVAADGAVLASTSIGGLGTAWRQHSYTLRTAAGVTASSIGNQIVVTLANGCAKCATISAAGVWLSVVSLFPPTYKNRRNGLRPDIMAKLAAMHLGQLRIPGGNYLEGNTLDTRFNWKNTIGPISARPGHQNTAWGYWSTDGMGLPEYLEMAEDIGAQPMLAVFAGYTLNGQHVNEPDFGPYVQDALDEIEYAIGPTSSTWGAKRAADGHPAPFNLQYVEVGNEDQFDSSGSYQWRFADMFDAIRAAYPQLQIVATTAVTSRTPDVLDEHFYQPPAWFVSHSTMFDTADRNGPRILVGEYGAQEGNPTGTLAAAIGEAALLTGLERASDIVLGSMFAPMIVNENQSNWPVNMIGINAAGSYGAPSYWVQDMFSNNLGAHVLGTVLSSGSVLREDVTASTGHGSTTFYVKVVNPSSQVQSAQLTFNGAGTLGSTVTQTVLTGDPGARNTLTAPNTIAPVSSRLVGVHNGHTFTFPPNSVTVLKITSTVEAG